MAKGTDDFFGATNSLWPPFLQSTVLVRPFDLTKSTPSPLFLLSLFLLLCLSLSLSHSFMLARCGVQTAHEGKNLMTAVYCRHSQSQDWCGQRPLGTRGFLSRSHAHAGTLSSWAAQDMYLLSSTLGPLTRGCTAYSLRLSSTPMARPSSRPGTGPRTPSTWLGCVVRSFR